MEKDGVSICITAYKAQEFIKECLDSVISQTWFKNIRIGKLYLVLMVVKKL